MQHTVWMNSNTVEKSKKDKIQDHIGNNPSCFCCFSTAVAEIRDPLGAHCLSVLLGLGDGSGRHGLIPNAGHQSLRTERIHTKMGGALFLTSRSSTSKKNLLYYTDSPPQRALAELCACINWRSESDSSTKPKISEHTVGEDTKGV